MRQVFADANYWIALLNNRDSLHERALEASRLCSTDQFVTREMVLVEVLNGFSGRGQQLRRAAAGLVEKLRTDQQVIVVAQTGKQFEQALGHYNKMMDKGWSLTDGSSFLIMEAAGIHSALTKDRHYVQAGFETLLG